MKKLIILCFLFSYLSVFSLWEITNWKSQSEIYQIWAAENTVITYGDYLISTDKGMTWGSFAYTYPFTTGIYSLAFKDSTIYIGSFGNIHVSDDYGKTWEIRNTGLPEFLVSALLIVGDKIFAGLWNEGVYMSTDKGHTWTAKNNRINKKSVYALAEIGNYIIASTGDSIFVSSDMGESWNHSRNGLEEFGFYNKLIVSKDKLFTATFEDTYNGSRNNLYMSTNYGQTWIKKNSSVFESIYMYSITVIEDRLFVGTRDSLYYSDDMGDTWITTSLIKNGYRGAVYLASSGQMIYAALGTELFKSSDKGETWITVRNALNYSVVHSLFSDSSKIFAATLRWENNTTYNDGLYYSTDKGDTWIRNGFENLTVYSIFKKNHYYFAGTSDGLYRSEVSDLNWIKINSEFSYSVLSELDGNLTINGKDCYYMSSDNGDNWQKYCSGLPEQQSVTLLKEIGNLWFACVDSGVYISYDKGENWQEKSNGLPKTILRITSAETIDNCIFLGTNHGIIVSTDAGESWMERNSGISSGSDKLIEVKSLVKTGNTIFAGIRNKGIYFSTDNGLNWTYANCQFFRNLEVSSLAIHDGYIYAGTDRATFGQYDGDAIYRAKLSDFGITDVKENRIELGTIIYPNPTGNFITLSESDTKLYESYEIYDISGRLLQKSIFDSNRIDISALESGSYYLRLLSPSGIATAGFNKMK
jgi:photosystem II stability/assembly factor-like uncharacterized protein